MTTHDALLPAVVLQRKAVVSVRQSTPQQVQLNLESQRRQYEHKGWHLIGRQGEAAILGRPDPVRQMLWSEIMPSRYVRNHRTRRDRLGNRPFSSSLHRRRRTAPVTSARR